MRITEIISELDLKGTVKKAANTVRSMQQGYKQGYQKGANAVAGILNPSKSADQPEDNLRDAVSRVVNNQRIYDAEQNALQTAGRQVRGGILKTQLDPQQLGTVLRTAGLGKPINDAQRALLSKFLQEL